MKKMFAILFMFLYLTASTELHQLLKLPILIEHFVEHQSINNNLTFLDFLSMHYSHEDDHDGDKEKDMKLPFKSHSCCNETNSFVALVPSQVFTFIAFQTTQVRVKISSCYAFCTTSSHLNAIWQPPQIC